MGTWKYQPALDGLRGLAVVAVFAYHLGYARGGFLGVDVFFVLSGYLITSLLLDERDREGRIDLSAFWGRRARRLLPALFVLLIAIAAWNSTSPLGPGIRGDAFATLFYVANWHMISSQSYFSHFAAPSPLRHTWSLAIEEQFYIAWPLVTGFLVSKTRYARLIIAAIVGSVVVQALLFRPGDPSASYYDTFARAHEILIGALIATVGSRFLRRLAAPAFVGLIAAMALLPDTSAIYYRGGSLVFSCLVAAVVLGQPRALTFGPLRRLGQISYGVYLWHWPIILLLTPRVGVSGHLLNGLRVATTLVVASLSYVLIERPIRHATFTWPKRLGAVATVAATVTLLFTAVAPATGSASPIGPVADQGEDRPGLVWQPVVLDRGSPSVVIVGDSVAAVLAPAFERVSHWGLVSAARRGCAVTGAVTLNQDGTLPSDPLRCSNGVAALQGDAVEVYRPRFVVLYSQTEALPVRYQGTTLWTGPSHDVAMESLFNKAYERLTRYGAKLVVVMPLPRPMPANGCDDTTTRSLCEQIRIFNQGISEWAGVLTKFAWTHARITLIDLRALVCGGQSTCPHAFHGVEWRPDLVHFSPTAGQLVAREVMARIDA